MNYIDPDDLGPPDLPAIADALGLPYDDGPPPLTDADAPPEPPDTPVTPVTLSQSSTQERDNVTGVTPPSGGVLSGLITGPELFAADYPPVTFVVPRLIPEGMTLLVGAPKIGKSWLTYGIALAAASGRTVLGETVERRPVLHLAMEDSLRRLHARARILGYDDGPQLWSAMIRLPEAYPASSVIEAWLEGVQVHSAPPLVVIDTLGRVRGSRRQTESPYDHDYRVGAAIKSLADSVPGMAFVVVHHDRKAGSADFVESVSGTNGLAGSADTIVVVQRDRATPDGLLSVTSRDEVEGIYAASFLDGSWSLDGGSWDEAAKVAAVRAAAFGKGDTAHRVVQWIDSNGGGARPAQVAEALGISSESARQTLSRLHREGRLGKTTDGHYTTPAVSS